MAKTKQADVVPDNDRAEGPDPKLLQLEAEVQALREWREKATELLAHHQHEFHRIRINLPPGRIKTDANDDYCAVREFLGERGIQVDMEVRGVKPPPK